MGWWTFCAAGWVLLSTLLIRQHMRAKPRMFAEMSGLAFGIYLSLMLPGSPAVWAIAMGAAIIKGVSNGLKG